MDYPGSFYHTDQVWQDCLQSLHATLDRLPNIPQLHTHFLLLRHCMDACRVQHLLRSCSFTASSPHCSQAMLAIRRAFDLILGEPCSDMAWFQACLPSRKGGLGLKNPFSFIPRLGYPPSCPSTKQLPSILGFHQHSHSYRSLTGTSVYHSYRNF